MTVLEHTTAAAAAAAGVDEPVQSQELALSHAIVPEELYRAIRLRDELQQILQEAKLKCQEVQEMQQQEPMPIGSREPGFWSGFTYGSWMNNKQQHQTARFSSMPWMNNEQQHQTARFSSTPPPMAGSSSSGMMQLVEQHRGESATVLDESRHLPEKRAWKRPCFRYSQMPPEMQQQLQKTPEQQQLPLVKVKSEFGEECIIDHPRNTIDNPRNKVIELRAEYQRALEAASKAEQRPRRIDLQVASSMRNEGRWLNSKSKIVGLVPGVQVGDLFLYRVEMCMLGLHRQPRAGIDVGLVNGLSGDLVAVAVAVVMMVGDSSAGYADDKEMGETVVYSGQGAPPEDQKLERGNRGLFNSKVNRTPVRLIRGYRGPSGVVYSYDGLYMVEDMIYEKGVAGNMVYKFLMHRMKHQAPLRLLKMAVPLASTAPPKELLTASSSSSAMQEQVACLPVAGGFTELLSNVCFQDSNSLVNFDRAARNLPDLNLNVDDEDDLDYSFLDLEDDEAVLAAKCTQKDGYISAAVHPKKDDLRKASKKDESETAQKKVDPTPVFDVPQIDPCTRKDGELSDPKTAQKDDPAPAFVPQTGPSADSAAVSPGKPTLRIPSLVDVLPAAAPAAPAAAVKKSRKFPPLSSLFKNNL